VKRIPKLRAFELPFVYMEMGERREALVKVRLCVRCEGKLTWKPERERSNVKEEEVSDVDEDEGSEEERAVRKENRRDEGDTRRSRHRSRSPRRKSRSRSRSPRRDRHLI
jgi:protein FRA10AC1